VLYRDWSEMSRLEELKKEWRIGFRRPMTLEVRNRDDTKQARFDLRSDMGYLVVPKDSAAGGRCQSGARV
jgi:hypothetical protein